MSDDQRVAMRFEDVAANIMSALGSTDPIIAGNQRDFWHTVAIAHNVKPKANSVATAQAVFDAIGETWDDDYAEDDTDLVTLAGLEALFTRVKNTAVGEQANDASEVLEEDDDDIGPLNASFSKGDWTISVLLDWVKKGTLILNPEWQRNFVWSPQKMRRLIESILLGLPIPSFLFFKDSKTGNTYVIDGRQRLETLSRFTAPKEGKGEPKLRFKTFPPSTPGWREGERLHAAASKYYDQLLPEFKSTFDSAPLVTNTFTELPLGALYQIFKRYNTGAVALNPAEIRNAVYQATPLHQMMYRLAGEHRSLDLYLDEAEARIGEDLQATMGGKASRYGAYDFIGRFFAFRHMQTGSVAKATNDFMEKHYSANAAVVEGFRREFIAAFNATRDLYENAFVKSAAEPFFHAFLATVQMTTTSRLLGLSTDGTQNLTSAAQIIRDDWDSFAAARTLEKQNSSLFWNAQRDWFQHVTKRMSASTSFPA